MGKEKTQQIKNVTALTPLWEKVPCFLIDQAQFLLVVSQQELYYNHSGMGDGWNLQQ